MERKELDGLYHRLNILQTSNHEMGPRFQEGTQSAAKANILVLICHRIPLCHRVNVQVVAVIQQSTTPCARIATLPHARRCVVHLEHVACVGGGKAAHVLIHGVRLVAHSQVTGQVVWGHESVKSDALLCKVVQEHIAIGAGKACGATGLAHAL